MRRSRHTRKEIEEVLQKLEAEGWMIVPGKGHVWGLLRCPRNSEECRCGVFCQMSVWSTPKDPGRHARQLYQKATACVFREGETDDE